MTYPIQNQVWTQDFEDVQIYPDYRTNRNQYSALETARYLLQHPEMDPYALLHAKRLLDWVAGFFAIDSVTMGGLHEKGLQWGAEVLSEQVNDMDKMFKPYRAVRFRARPLVRSDWRPGLQGTGLSFF